LLRLGIPLKHFLFISTSIYRTDAIKPYLRTGYMLTATLAPHLGMTFLALGSRGLAVISAEPLIEYAPPTAEQVWSVLTLGESMQLLMNLPLEREAAKLLRARQPEWMRPSQFLLGCLYFGLKRKDARRGARMFGAFLVYTQPLWAIVLYSICLFGFANCALSIGAIKAIAGRLTKKNLSFFEFAVDNKRQ
jgi:hypothetical protein